LVRLSSSAIPISCSATGTVPAGVGYCRHVVF